MSEKNNIGLDILKRQPGLILVIIGFMSIYSIAGLGDVSESSTISEPSTIVYLTVGLGFLVTLAGIIILFRDLGRPAIAEAELDIMESSDIEHAVRQLGKNYDILRRQATQGFVLAGTFMALGILVILAGSVGEMFGFTRTASNLTTMAGVIVEAVSGLGLYLFRETSKRLNSTSDQLHEMWKILAAFQKAETLPDDKKSEVVVSLINKLVETH